MVWAYPEALMDSKIASYNVFPTAVLLKVAVGDGSASRMVAWAISSRRQVRDALKTHRIVDETDRPHVELMADMDRAGLPEESSDATILIGGSAPMAMHNLSCFMEAFRGTESPLTTPRTNVFPRICTFLISKSPVVPDGMIGYADANEAFHFWVFHSKWEGLRIARAIGGSVTERKSAEVNIDQCGLPARGGSSVHLTGEIAKYLCLAGELRSHIDRTAS